MSRKVAGLLLEARRLALGLVAAFAVAILASRPPAGLEFSQEVVGV